MPGAGLSRPVRRPVPRAGWEYLSGDGWCALPVVQAVAAPQKVIAAGARQTLSAAGAVRVMIAAAAPQMVIAAGAVRVVMLRGAAGNDWRADLLLRSRCRFRPVVMRQRLTAVETRHFRGQ